MDFVFHPEKDVDKSRRKFRACLFAVEDDFSCVIAASYAKLDYVSHLVTSFRKINLM
jgi:hypothetical protein